MVRSRRSDPLPQVVRYERQFFLDRIWAPDYKPDQHVTLLGPTECGKTYLMQQLLERSCTPHFPAVMLVCKPTDAQVESWRKRVAWKKVTIWPPPPNPFQTSPPPGYILWPPHSFNEAVDDARHAAVFHKAIMDSYRRGHRVIVADEVAGLQDLGLTRALETVWERGRSQPCSLWASSQRPSHISSHAYIEPKHVFLAYIGEERAEERFGEISGVDTRLVRETVANLNPFEWLYIRRKTREMCIILP